MQGMRWLKGAGEISRTLPTSIFPVVMKMDIFKKMHDLFKQREIDMLSWRVFRWLMRMILEDNRLPKDVRSLR
jgi:hypothetical protein